LSGWDSIRPAAAHTAGIKNPGTTEANLQRPSEAEAAFFLLAKL